MVPQSAGASEGCSRDDGFVTAVVCDGSGQTDRYRGDVVICSEDDTEKPCMFYAQVDRGDRDSGSTVPAPVVVSLTQEIPDQPEVPPRRFLPSATGCCSCGPDQSIFAQRAAGGQCFSRV